ncbi:sulfocyanin-like copper-binding protein [Deinococcus pimensis]|uniref:sulfocyanin-like copper-binding protein n=1 Tax=Deinococcus pimensis TaxID=309888 RepID=UPI0004B4A07D|nr:sulfocyanin-like copper-binding protein [Deinococcus pimensis]
MIRRTLATLALASTVLALAALPNAPKAAPTWVTNAPQHRAAVLVLKAGSPAAHGGLNFNGASDGEHGFVVPLGWRVVVNFYNVGTMPHSAVVVSRPESGTPAASYAVEDAAFPGAAHKIVVNGSGLYAGKLDFVASKPGRYIIVCARPNHAMKGQFVTLDVSEGATEASWQ